jgi:hypothetical protein
MKVVHRNTLFQRRKHESGSNSRNEQADTKNAKIYLRPNNLVHGLRWLHAVEKLTLIGIEDRSRLSKTSRWNCEKI